MYIERCTLEDSKSIMKTRKAIRKALQLQIENKGFSLIEVLSPCPTGWKLEPMDSREWITKNMLSVFPPNVYKDRTDAVSRPTPPKPVYDAEEILNILGVKSANQKKAAKIDPTFPTHKLVLAGFGGQGILLLGQLLAKSSMREGKFVSWLPSYGPEMRGGTANCQRSRLTGAHRFAVCLASNHVGGDESAVA